MKRTNYKLCCGKKNGYDVYRSVYEKDGKFFVKWNGTIIDVTEDRSSFTYGKF